MSSAVSVDERTGLPSALISRVAYSPSAGWMELTTSSVGSVTAVRGRRMEEVVEGNSLPVVLSSRRVTKGGQPQGRRRKRRKSSTSRRVSPPLTILLPPHLPPQLPPRTSRGSWLSPRRRVRDLPNSPAETTRLSRRRRPPSETDFMIHGRDRSTLSCEEAGDPLLFLLYVTSISHLYIVCMLVMLTLHLSTPTALSRNRE